MKNLNEIFRRLLNIKIVAIPILFLVSLLISCGGDSKKAIKEAPDTVIDADMTVLRADCEKIDVATAHAYYMRYMESGPDAIIPEAIVMNNSNIEGVEYLKGWISPAPAGYRAYFGINDDGNPVSMLVGVDAEGNDIVTFDGEKAICACSGERFGTCPLICDDDSPITDVSDTIP